MTIEDLAWHRVLVVEDDYFVPEELAAELRERGIFTVFATSYDNVFVPEHLRDASYPRKPPEITTVLRLIRSRAPRRAP